MDKRINADFIIETLKKWVEEKSSVLDPKLYLDAAMKLAILLGDETNKLSGLRQKVAKMKLDYLMSQQKRNVSAVELWVETTEEHKAMKNQEAKVDQVEEMIRIAKLQARSEGNF